MHSNVRRTGIAALSAGALVLPLAAPASAAEMEELASGLIGPLGMSVGPHGDIYVAESFAGLLSKIGTDGEKSVLTSLEGGEIAGIDASRSSQTAFVTTTFGPEPAADLRRIDRRGRVTQLADLAAWEAEENPDGDVHYGFSGLPSNCEIPDVPPYGGTDGYDGIVESHPYAVANVPGGWVVADAAGNSLISVRRNGATSTLAVMPAETTSFTVAQIRTLNEETEAYNRDNPPEEPDMPLLPECAAGATYTFEAVPTDVELGPNGLLYVSTLPGGAESLSMGGRGRVYTVDRRTGDIDEIASGLATATDLAVTPTGTVYVAELFGNQISKIVNGEAEKVVEVPLPSTVEYHRGALYATTDIFNQEDGGSLVRIPLSTT